MLQAALILLKECGVTSPFALGGGTALSAHYWQHRYSTDIDIFIYTDGNEKALKKIRPATWNGCSKAAFQEIGFDDAYKASGASFPGYYIELAINESEKIQFFETKNFCNRKPKETPTPNHPSSTFQGIKSSRSLPSF